MDKKIFFFDIDGTLAQRNIMPDDTKAALRAGHYVFICTGRPYAYAKHYFGEYVYGFVCSNGRYIVNGDKVLLDKPLTKEEIHDFIESFIKFDCGYNINGINVGYAYGIDKKKLADMQTDYDKPYFIEDFHEEDIQAHIFDIHFENQEQLKGITEYLKGQVVFNEYHGHNSADATIIGYDKGESIVELIKILKINKDNSYAFGDGYNDICMFKVVGHPIVMGNGVEEVKKASEYITSDIFDGGIYKAFFILLKKAFELHFFLVFNIYKITRQLYHF